MLRLRLIQQLILLQPVEFETFFFSFLFSMISRRWELTFQFDVVFDACIFRGKM